MYIYIYIHICISACQSNWHSKYVYHLSNIKTIHTKKNYKILLSLMLHTSIDVF